MNQNEMMTEYLRWVQKAVADKDVMEELISMRYDAEKIEDAFYRDLEFGTGGLRGVIGAGTNRMNIYTVAKSSQGLANYVIKKFPENNRKIVPLVLLLLILEALFFCYQKFLYHTNRGFDLA